MKRLFLLGSVMLLCSIGLQAQPLSGYCGRETVYNNDSTNLFWQVDTASRILTITGVGQMKDYSTDTKAPWYSWRNFIQRINIGDQVTTVGSYAMYFLQKADSVHFGHGLTKINEYAFYYCGVRRVRLGNNVETIGNHAFASCDSLLLVDFGESSISNHNSHSFANNYALRLVVMRKVKTLGSYAFYSARNLNSVEFGDSLKTINYGAFHYCTSLKAIHIPCTTTNISSDAFNYTEVLDTITVCADNLSYNSAGNCNAIMRTSDNALMVGCKSTVIPNYTTSIADYAFRGCIGLTSVDIPSSVYRIGYCAFDGCSSLSSLTIPEGVVELGGYAFHNCSSLQTVDFPNSVTRADCDVFRSCPKLSHPIYNNRLFVRLPMRYKGTFIVPEGIKSICCSSFSDCDSVTSISIPNSVTDIGGYAFQYCYNLRSITLSDSITSLSNNLFYSCRSLQSLIIPDAVTNISSYVFNGCKSLKSLTFPAALQTLDYSLVSGCDSLTTIIWNAKDAKLSWFFYQNYSRSQIQNQISSYHPFYSIRQQITSFTFGDSVKVIPRYLCYGMENLTSISLGCNIDSIENYVFDGCKCISTIYYNVRSLNNPALYINAPFYDIRDSVTNFIFGDSVQHIPAYLCHGMSRLRQLHIPENVSSIGEYAFRYMGTLDSISVDPGNSYYDSRGNCNALIETASNTLLLGNYKTRIPADITGIDACAFRNVRNLTSATIPEGVTFIGKEAFNGCKDLKNLTLPHKLGAINDYTFQDCDSLYNISLPDSLWYIGLRAFANCTHLQNITLPESTELIDQYAFSGCTGLQAITCNAIMPPSIQQTTFRGSSCPIYVPCPSINDYRTAYIWSDYGSRVAGQYYYTLSARPNDYSFGRATIVQQPDCEHNAILLAEAAVGHEFVSWQDTLGNVLSTNAQYEFRLDEDMSIVAHFVKNIVSIEDVEQSVRVRVHAHNVLVWAETQGDAALYDLTGNRVDATPLTNGSEATLHAPDAGIYIVKIGQHTQKVIIK